MHIRKVFTIWNPLNLKVILVYLADKQLLDQGRQYIDSSLHNSLSLLPLHSKVEAHLVPTRGALENRQKDEEDILGLGGGIGTLPICRPTDKVHTNKVPKLFKFAEGERRHYVNNRVVPVVLDVEVKERRAGVKLIIT